MEKILLFSSLIILIVLSSGCVCSEERCGHTCLFNQFPTPECHYHLCEATGEKIQNTSDVIRLLNEYGYKGMSESGFQNVSEDRLINMIEAQRQDLFCDDYRCWRMEGKKIYELGIVYKGETRDEWVELVDEDGNIYFWDIRCG